MTQSDATSIAKNDAAQVTKLDHTKGGPESAYAALMADYLGYQKSGASQANVKQYWSEMTSDLTHSGVLPDVSLAWGHEQLSGGPFGIETPVGHQIDVTGQHGFTQWDLKTFAKNSGPEAWSGSGTATDQANATFAASLASEVTSIPGYLTTASQLQSRELQPGARQAQAPLFANNAALLKSLDNAANPGGSLDGNVGNNDLKAWLSSYNNATDDGKVAQSAGSVFTAANAKYVQGILDGNYNGNGDGLNSAGFQVDQLGHAGGFIWDNNFDGKKNGGQDYTDLVNSYNGAAAIDAPVSTPTPATSATPAVPTDTSSTTYKTAPVKNGNGQVTQITLNNGQTDSLTYDPQGKISQIDVRSADGKITTLKPDKSGSWTGLTPDGSSVTDVGISSQGNIYFKQSDGQFATTLPGGDTKVLSTQDQTALSDALKPYQSTTVQNGDGYLRVAGRVLGISNTNNPDVQTLAADLETLIKSENLPNGTVLQPNAALDLTKINDPSLNALIAKTEQEAINKITI